MGCDIHSVGQVFRKGEWITMVSEPGGDDRNYDSFAVLANVRNGSGFAGCTTGEGWPFISEARGFPSGFVTDNNKDHEGNWMGDHSHSWVLLSEIEDFIETKMPKSYKIIGVVDRSVFDEIQAGTLKKPKSWSGWVSGGDTKVISEDAAKRGEPGSHVQMSWHVDAKDRLYMLTACVEALRKLADEQGVKPNEVRLVFGFDS